MWGMSRGPPEAKQLSTLGPDLVRIVKYGWVLRQIMTYQRFIFFTLCLVRTCQSNARLHANGVMKIGGPITLSS